MSYTYTYLVPLNDQPEPVEYGRRVKEFLMGNKIIVDAPEDYELAGAFVGGDNWLAPFEEREDWDSGFEFGDIFSGPHLTIVPCDDQPLEPKCPKCQTDAGQELNGLMYPEEETSVERMDFTGLTVTCPKCAGVYRPDELIDSRGHGIFLTKRYVCFVSAGKFRTEWLAEFDKAAGTPHRLVTYWYT